MDQTQTPRKPTHIMITIDEWIEFGRLKNVEDQYKEYRSHVRPLNVTLGGPKAAGAAR